MYDALADQGSEKSVRARLLYADILKALGHNDEAVRHLDNALGAANTTVPKSTALIAHLQADLARVDAALGDNASAGRLRAEAQTSLADIPAGPNTDRDAALRQLDGARAINH
jgi:serine/threonine-protein kinase